jgi:hypothetical protein
MTHISTRDPALWAELMKSVRSMSSGSNYIAVDDASYDGLRQYAAQVKDFNFVEDK